jgi:hypothetical protein
MSYARDPFRRRSRMTFPGRRSSSVDPPKPFRPLRGGPIPVTEDDLPFYAALVGRATNADDRTAVLLSSFELSDEEDVVPDAPRWRWRRLIDGVSGAFRRIARATSSRSV